MEVTALIEITTTGSAIIFGDALRVSFQRTLRIPDDGRTYPLPPGLGAFPIHRVSDYADRAPAAWRERGGVFIPMYQREALWISFAQRRRWKPSAVQVGVGNVNAISGQRWTGSLHSDPQDYLVCPDQPWLDGINAGKGMIRQFVAMPLGEGYTVEAQISEEDEVGGMRIAVFEPRPGLFPDEGPASIAEERCVKYKKSGEMGLGAGGRMRQKIYPDRHGIETWDAENTGSIFVHIVNSDAYRELTGQEPPPSPVSAAAYTRYRFPGSTCTTKPAATSLPRKTWRGSSPSGSSTRSTSSLATARTTPSTYPRSRSSC
jgi:hypothetical protein